MKEQKNKDGSLILWILKSLTLPVAILIIPSILFVVFIASNFIWCDWNYEKGFISKSESLDCMWVDLEED